MYVKRKEPYAIKALSNKNTSIGFPSTNIWLIKDETRTTPFMTFLSVFNLDFDLKLQEKRLMHIKCYLKKKQ